VFYITYIWKFTQSKSIKTFIRAVSLNLAARICLKHNLDFEEVHPRWEKCSQFLSWRWRSSGNISARKITHIIGEYLGQMNGHPFWSRNRFSGVYSHWILLRYLNEGEMESTCSMYRGNACSLHITGKVLLVHALKAYRKRMYFSTHFKNLY